MAYIVTQKVLVSLNSDDFNRHMTLWLDQALRYLGAVTKEQIALAFEAVDGLWWDSSARIPQKYLVLKHNYNVTPIQTPLSNQQSNLPHLRKKLCSQNPLHCHQDL